MPDDLSPRVDLEARLQAQQETLNALLIEITARLSVEQGLHVRALARHTASFTLLEGIAQRLDAASAHHAEHMRELRTILAAMKDMLERGNGH